MRTTRPLERLQQSGRRYRARRNRGPRCRLKSRPGKTDTRSAVAVAGLNLLQTDPLLLVGLPLRGIRGFGTIVLGWPHIEAGGETGQSRKSDSIRSEAEQTRRWYSHAACS